MDVSHQLPPVNLPSESSPLPSPGIELTLFLGMSLDLTNTFIHSTMWPSIPAEGSGEPSEGKLTGDNWHPLNMARGTRTVYPGELSSTFQPPEEGRSVQRPKRCDKHGEKNEDNSPKNVNNVHNTTSQKYRQNYKISRNDIQYVIFSILCYDQNLVLWIPPAQEYCHLLSLSELSTKLEIFSRVFCEN